MLNYKQLYYFWNVAKMGGVIRASERLNVTPQTISGQLGELEKTLGTLLFRRTGRRLEMTQAGEFTLARAEEIFQIGHEIETMLGGHAGREGALFRVGVVNAVPKSMAYQLLSAPLLMPDPVRLVCHDDKAERLFGELAIHQLDLVIADRALPRELGIRAYNHELGQSQVAFCAHQETVGRLTGDFPDFLQHAPLLMPSEGTSLRGTVNHWLLKHQLTPKIVAEFDDMALLKAFGHAGQGVFPVPQVMVDEVVKQYGVVQVGCSDEMTVRFYAISHERRLKHPAVLAVSNMAKNCLFSSSV
jgi:LysR family transcriptional activator of nhaA